MRVRPTQTGAELSRWANIDERNTKLSDECQSQQRERIVLYPQDAKQKECDMLLKSVGGRTAWYANTPLGTVKTWRMPSRNPTVSIEALPEMQAAKMMQFIAKVVGKT